MTYDAADGYVVLFGGLSGTRAVNETWKFQDGAWTNITAVVSGAPSPRYQMAMTFDAADGIVLAFGGVAMPSPACSVPVGFAGCPLNDTWSYSAGTWSPIHASCAQGNLTASLPTNCWMLPGGPAPIVYDSHDGYVLMTAAFPVTEGSPVTTWIYAHNVWIRISPGKLAMPAHAIGGLAYDAADGYVVGFGSEASDYRGFYNYTVAGNGQAENYTYAYSNYTWRNLSSANATAPSVRYDPGFAYDTREGYLLMFGGWYIPCQLGPNATRCAGAPLVELGDTWGFHNGTWFNLTGGASPGPRGAPRLTDDPADHTMLVVGGWNCGPVACHDPGGGWYCVGNPCSTAKLNGTPGPGTWGWGAYPPLTPIVIVATPEPVTAGAPVQFSMTLHGGTAPLGFAWSFGDGSTASTENASHTFHHAGTFVATAWANDSANETRNRSINVTVDPSLTMRPAASANPADAGLPVTFTPGVTNGTPPFSYSWSFGDANRSPLPSPTHIYRTNGTYLVNLTVTDQGAGVGKANLTVVVHPGLNLTVNVSPQPADLGQLVNCTTNVSGGTAPYTYAWAFGDGGTGGDLANISHIYTTNGPFALAVTVTDAVGGSTTTIRPLSIALNVSILSNGTLGAAPLPLAFRSHVTGGHSGYTYAWHFGDGTTSALPNPDHVYLAQGEYNASLEVTDATGGRARGDAHPVVVVNGGGPLSLQLRLADPAVPFGGVETLTAEPSGGVGLYALTWSSVPNGCAAVPPLALRCAPPASGSYRVTASVGDARGGFATASISFAVGDSAPVGTLPTSPLRGGGVAWDARSVSVVAVGVVAIVAVLAFVLGTTSRLGGRAGRAADPYGRFRRLEPPEHPPLAGNSPGGPEDPLGDLL
ncbi:MAG: PKD domain-containing protein [Thermoplasmata archaeon]|nr:PKD domain-containing protein [Thermoplasmata archaeon]